MPLNACLRQQLRDCAFFLALRDLVLMNTIQNIKQGTYMLNPTIACSGSHDMRRNLINQYSVLLVTKQKDPVFRFLPQV